MRVIIQMGRAVAAEMRKSVPQEAIVGELTQMLKELQLKPRRLHPTAQDERLQTYYVVTTADIKTAHEVAVRLQECLGIDAAYVKQESEEPS